MIKFLTRKKLLSLIPFQAASPYDPEYIWPEAYSGDIIEDILRKLKECPSYQIDKNHSHCGLRARIQPGLEYIQYLTEGAIGLGAVRWKTDRVLETWAVEKKRGRDGKKSFVVAGEPVGEDERGRFDFVEVQRRIERRGMVVSIDVAAKDLFTAEKWIWTMESDDGDGGVRFSAKSTPSLKF